MKHDFCRDFIGLPSVIDGGGRYDRTACRDMPRGGARETERDRICSSNTLTTDAVEGGPTPCWCGGESPLYVASCACFVTTGWIRRKSCTRYERVEVRACAACCVCPLTSYVYHLPTGQAQVLRACVRPNHSNSSTGLQYQQQQ